MKIEGIYSILLSVAILGATVVPLVAKTEPHTAMSGGTSAAPKYGGGCKAAYQSAQCGFIGLGQELASNPFGEPAGPISSLLVVRSNGDGTLTVQRTDFADGILVVTPILPGTYTVGDDCTITDSIPIPETGGINALTGYGVVVQNGMEVDYMATTPGVAIHNYIGRRIPSGCTNGTLEGVYGLNGTGRAFKQFPWITQRATNQRSRGVLRRAW